MIMYKVSKMKKELLILKCKSTIKYEKYENKKRRINT